MKTVMNFREVGGYPVAGGTTLKKSLLYRSGSIDKAKGADLKQIRSLKLKTIIDLRSAKEYHRNSGVSIEAQKITLPLQFDSIARERLQPFLWKRGVEQQIIEAINSVYGDMVDRVFMVVGELFRVLLQPDNYPVLINCRAGKDRTGFVYAVIEMALGVETGVIIQDYLKSNEFVFPKARRILKPLKILTLGWLPAGNIQLAFTAQEKYIRTVIDKINHQYAGIEGYLERCGISGNELERLRGMLIQREG